MAKYYFRKLLNGKGEGNAGTLREINEWTIRTHDAGSGQKDTYCLSRKPIVYLPDGD